MMAASRQSLDLESKFVPCATGAHAGRVWAIRRRAWHASAAAPHHGIPEE